VTWGGELSRKLGLEYPDYRKDGPHVTTTSSQFLVLLSSLPGGVWVAFAASPALESTKGGAGCYFIHAFIYSFIRSFIHSACPQSLSGWNICGVLVNSADAASHMWGSQPGEKEAGTQETIVLGGKLWK
jgi:hypothetical protein